MFGEADEAATTPPERFERDRDLTSADATDAVRVLTVVLEKAILEILSTQLIKLHACKMQTHLSKDTH